MKTTTTFAAAALLLAFSAIPAAPASAAPTEIKGAAALDHACGKTSVKHMGLVHAGKMEEAVKLGTKEMQAEWNALPKEDREMMSGMMKDMSSSEADHAAAIKTNGVLAVDGENATLTVKQETKEGGGTSTSTMTQKFKIAGATCSIAR
jgi:hypothetical protein